MVLYVRRAHSHAIICWEISSDNVLVVCMVYQAMEFARCQRNSRGKGDLIVVEDGEESAEGMGAEEFEVCTLHCCTVMKCGSHTSRPIVNCHLGPRPP